MTVLAPDVAWHGRPCTGETLSGDAAVIVEREGGLLLAIVDALGHGIAAHEVARQAVATLRSHAGPDVAALLRKVHEGLRGTLGAAVGVCWLDLASGLASWTAVGNVMLRTIGPLATRLVGADGLVGHALPTPRVTTLRPDAVDLLLLTTDGIREHVTPEDYPGLLGDSAGFAARQVVTRFGREHDDATCIALRMRR